MDFKKRLLEILIDPSPWQRVVFVVAAVFFILMTAGGSLGGFLSIFALLIAIAFLVLAAPRKRKDDEK